MREGECTHTVTRTRTSRGKKRPAAAQILWPTASEWASEWVTDVRRVVVPLSYSKCNAFFFFFFFWLREGRRRRRRPPYLLQQRPMSSSSPSALLHLSTVTTVKSAGTKEKKRKKVTRQQQKKKKGKGEGCKSSARVCTNTVHTVQTQFDEVRGNCTRRRRRTRERRVKWTTPPTFLMRIILSDCAKNEICFLLLFSF